MLTAKDMRLTQGGPGSNAHTGKGEKETGGTRDKKANIWESAEGVVGERAKGPNVGTIANR